MGTRAEEWTEDSRQDFFGDASAVVLDIDSHLSASSIFTVAFAQPHDYVPISINSLDSIGKQSVYYDFDLRRVNVHDDWRRIGDKLYLYLPAMR
jgi:hypothetical protein